MHRESAVKGGVKMAKKGGNPQNLITTAQKTPEKRKADASKGGKKTAENNRKRKAMKEQLEIMMQMPVVNKKGLNALIKTGIVDPEFADNQAAILAVAIQKAMNGRLEYIEFLRDTIGDKQTDTMRFDGGINIGFSPLPDGTTGDDLSG